jgi:curved DNA-binding protein CbpA
VKNYYELLEVAPTASSEDIKRAFRQQIARYHPDKVQHLGKEFQAMAAERAAELTEAYRILSHDQRRAEYDAARTGHSTATGVVAPTPPAPEPVPTPEPSEEAGRRGPAQFVNERASADAYVRKAILDRFRNAFTQVAAGGYDESQVRGFDISCVPKSKLFARNKGPRVLARFVAQVDAATLTDTWAQAGKWNVPADDAICVLLMGMSVAPPRELADAINEQRRRPARGAKVTVIPVNASTWEAHMPTDAPPVAKNLLARLRSSG